MKKCILILLLAFISCVTAACTPAAEPEPAPLESAQTFPEEVIAAPEPSAPAAPANPVPPQLIAHAGGAIYGYKLTNSLEALDSAYENGFRYIELDIECTSDGEYVLLHDWTLMAQRMLFEPGQRTLAEFKEAETFMGLTLMDIDALLAWLESHRDCYIITDAKCGNDPFLTALREKAGELASNFIPQAYSFEDFSFAVKSGFENVILTLYLTEAIDENYFTNFVRRERPWAVTIPEKHLSVSLLQSLAALDISTYTHTVNDLSYYEQWQEHGLHGIYTDYFYPAEWPY